MPSRRHRLSTPLVAAIVLLFAAGWFDGTVLRNLQRDVGRTFELEPALVIATLGHLAVAAGILVLAVLAWHSRSVAVGIAYLVAGSTAAFLAPINWHLAAQVNNAPAVMPEPASRFVSMIFTWQDGPLAAVATIGAGMLLIGLAVIGQPFFGRPAAAAAEPSVGSPNGGLGPEQAPVIDP
jgi:hypothetical protein